jgi:hypothetical protein
MVTRRAFMGGLLGVVAALAVTPAIEAAPTAAPAVPLETGGEVLQVGDVFTIQGRFAINPVTQKSMGVLRRFVVTQASTAGELAISPERFNPRLIDAGPYRNVNDARPFHWSDVRPEEAGLTVICQNGQWLPWSSLPAQAVRVLH